MAGDPTNASIWPNADVYVGPTTATNPASATDPFGASWGLIGLLDGDKGFVQSRDEDVSEHFAWGGILVRTSRRNFKLTLGFTALEDNEETRGLIWPNSPVGQIIVPRPERVKIAFETREDEKVRRLISKYQAEVNVDGDITDQEGDLTSYELVATIYPDSDGVLLIEQKSDGS